MTNLLHTNHKFATVHYKCSKNPTVNFDPLRHSCAEKKRVFFLPVSVDLHDPLHGWQHPNAS